ncbi:MAG: helix-turn-helix domain-containing protein [Bacteroidales bacterium]|jgi:excisionase family DNA binding protein|nr:helix-turn-helix domain-containing protein [Bacteroidales bacterium]MCK4638016.1 helix-turn-helix domain-containing protein [Bacteroidales bacterium]
MKYFTVKKASKYLNITEEKVRNMCRSNKLESARKEGNHWIISIKEIKKIRTSKIKILKVLRILLKIIIFIGLIASILTIIEYYTDHFISKKLSKSFIVPKLEPASDDEILILVMNFEQKGKTNYNISGRIAEKLTKALTMITGSNVHVKQIDEYIPRSEIFAPSAIGNKYNATILIWGNYDDAGIKPSFAIPSTLPYSYQYSDNPKGVEIDPHLHKIAREIGLLKELNINPKFRNDYIQLMGEGIEFNDFPTEHPDIMQYIRDILPNGMVYLSSLVIGLRYYYNENFSTSSRFLDVSIDISNKINMNIGLDKAYYYRGRIFNRNKDYEKSLVCFNKAISLNLNCFRAYIYRAHLYNLKKQFILSKQDCEFVLKENFTPGFYINKSDILNLYRYYALTCLNLNLNDISEEYYNKILEYKNEIQSKGFLAETYSYLGTIKYFKNEIKTAKSFFLHVIDLDSTIAYPYFWLSLISRDYNKLDSMNYFLEKYTELETDTTRRNLFLKIFKGE